MYSGNQRQLQHRIGAAIAGWGILNYRSFPWRYVHDPYRIAVSEILLRRTQAAQVSKVYNLIIDKYPSLSVMAHIPDDESLILSLGLHSRAGILREFAQATVDRYGGIVPQNREELLGLPGLGDYGVSAIRVFAFGYRDPLIDVNTVRIISRINGIAYTDSLRRSMKIHSMYSDLVEFQDPVIYGYSILDLGAKICRPVPKCNLCPLNGMCQYSVESGNAEMGF